MSDGQMIQDLRHRPAVGRWLSVTQVRGNCINGTTQFGFCLIKVT
jgi:hypothetical protein